jgi:hypothetical protein
LGHKIKISWARHVAPLGKRKVAYRVSVGSPVGKKLLGRPRGRREDNIKMEI